MSLPCLYLLRPQEALLPGLDSWITEVLGTLHGDPNWIGYDIVRDLIYDAQGWISAQSVADKVLRRLGPVVILNNVQTPVRLELNKRIGARTVILVRNVSDSDTLYGSLEEARARFLVGDPQLRRDLVLSLLLMNKLEKELMWGGNNKGYKWASDLPVGRGMPPKHAGRISTIIGLLFSNQILIRKTSQSKSKYALNPELRAEIYEAFQNRTLIHFVALWRAIEKDAETLSSRMLDELQNHAG